MMKSRYTEEQIAFALRQAETGTPVAEVIRRMGAFGADFSDRTDGAVPKCRPDRPVRAFGRGRRVSSCPLLRRTRAREIVRRVLRDARSRNSP
jgi:hypothetical protein